MNQTDQDREREDAALWAHVAHQVACPCAREDRRGRVRSGTGCQEERRLWAAAREALYGSRPRRD